MKKTRKVQLLAAMLGVTAAITGIALINDPVEVKAAEEETATFAMATGAAVRAVENEAGIRWTTTVNKAWYDQVVDGLAEGQTITDYSFGTWVTSANNVSSAKDLTETFSADEANEVKDLVCDTEKTPDFTDETTTTFTYYSSIVYTAEDLADYTDTEKKQAYAAELIARSYMKYTLNDGTECYVYATSNNNQRCMRSVALAAYQATGANELTGKQKDVVNDYFGEDKGTVTEFGDYYATESTGITSDYTAVYFKQIKIGKVNADNKLEITSKLTLGTNYTVTLFDNDGNYAKTTFQYITALLNQENFAKYMNVQGTSATDLAKIDGYYVLNSDIALGDTYYGNFNTFEGTLDGNGHTISGIKVNGKQKGGLFNNLQGTVKNVTLKGQTKHIGGVLAYQLGATTATTLENVYIEAGLNFSSAYTSSLTSQGAIATIVAAGAEVTLKNVVVKVTGYEITNDGYCAGALFGYGKKSTGQTTTITMENCYYIAKTGIMPLRTYTDGNDYYTAANQEELLGEATTSGNVTTFANGLTGYTGATVDAAKTEFDAAVNAGTVTLSDEVKAMMGYSTTDETTN